MEMNEEAEREKKSIGETMAAYQLAAGCARLKSRIGIR